MWPVNQIVLSNIAAAEMTTGSNTPPTDLTNLMLTIRVRRSDV